MERAEQGSSVLIAAAAEKIAVQIKGILPAGFGKVSFQPSMTKLKQKLTEERYDVVIICTPLPDYGLQSVIELAAKYPALSILMLVDKDVYQQAVYRAGDSGIMMLARPLSASSFQATVRMLGTMSRKVQRLVNDNLKLQQKLSDERYISRAKGLLIERGGMTEADAHRYLEQQAMNTSVTKREVAMKVIRDSGRIIISTQ
ncbi:ANTAR domain-containing response regulator [Oribacterium sp. WCC10]|uniref:ANTAR domain-containing response regulator n=1 Tax=Oribacterium sp. WCC10 TaxID=1855343 RepID=UPI0008E481DF|nr:ANTAR domain-containing protein [Oribacterium sp. WCC10]SFG05718.1 Two-component response regulator, AmiR/NasT family, consists of REC and RNA-binding antiterminator (ANTAR) domains [Oribacterium sp. WCC10]